MQYVVDLHLERHRVAKKAGKLAMFWRNSDVKKLGTEGSDMEFKSYGSNLMGRKNLMNSQIVFQNMILDSTIQISLCHPLSTLCGKDFCWVSEVLQLLAGYCIFP